MDETAVIIAQIARHLRETGNYSRTLTHRSLYFILPKDERKELYEAYNFGIYSPDVQRLLQYLEKNDKDIYAWSSYMEEKSRDAILLFLDYLIYNYNLEELNYYSGLAYLLDSTENEQDLAKIKGMARVMGWKEVYKKKDGELLKDIDEIRKIDNLYYEILKELYER
ncbi:MAG: hypothetical protein J7K83_01610 [Candidatus Aenigmarchaeota archaeon]|nr:hypothetical protein [Candidatus Aenigmarchaeota archaeon]